ncbi:MAG: hypothetical protein F6K09_07845 [Merismopedia sp. SIO2A8]|nr:hypothetical protein [Merismopedia sp. SIO2A8]
MSLTIAPNSTVEVSTPNADFCLTHAERLGSDPDDLLLFFCDFLDAP